MRYFGATVRYFGNGPTGSDASAATALSSDSKVAIVPADSSDRRDTRISRSSDSIPASWGGAGTLRMLWFGGA